jgi:hypothetical protein
MRKLLLPIFLLALFFVFSPRAFALTTNTWTGAINNNWSNAGNWDQGHKPAATENVVMANSVNCIIDEATAAINSLNMTGYTGTLSGTFNITVTVASGTSTVLFAGTSPTWSGVLNLNPAAGTTINLTMGSLSTAGTIGGITIAGTTTGVVSMQDNVVMAAAKTVTLTSGTLTTDGVANRTHSWGLFSSGGSSVRTLNLGNSIINISAGSDSAWSVASANLTVNCGTSTINFTYTGASRITGSFGNKTWYNVNFNGFTSTARDYTLDNHTFNNLSINPGATKSALFTIGYSSGKSMTVNGALTISGNSPINRLLFESDTLGSAFSVVLGASATLKTGSSDVDFRDITVSGGAANERDLSAITGGAGNCGGNTGFTFLATTWYWKTTGAGTYNMEDYHYWYTASNGGGSQMASTLVPLAQDNLYFDNHSVSGATTINQNMTRIGTNIDFSQGSGVGAVTWKINNVSSAGSAPQTIYGSLTLTSNVTLTINNNGYTSLYFESGPRSGETNTLTSAGKTLPSVVVQEVGATLTLIDGLTINSVLAGQGLTINNGTFTAVNGATNSVISTNAIKMIAGTTLTLGSATHLLTGTGAVFTGAGTLSASTGTLKITDTSATAITFAGGGLTTYNNIWFSRGTSTASNTITGANTFADIKDDGTGAHSLLFTKSTTTNVTTWHVNGAGGGGSVRIILDTADGAGTFTLHGQGTTLSSDWLDIRRSTVDASPVWYAGANSLNTASNTNWIFTAPPSAPAAPTNVAATDGTYTDKVTITWTKSTGATGYYVYRDSSNVSGLLGDVATYDDTGAAAPTITGGTAAATDGTYTDKVALSVSGQSGNNGTTSTYYVVAHNAVGNSANSATDTGYRGIGSLTYQWQRSAADSDASYSDIAGATTASYNDTGAPADGSGRYFKVVENATGASQQTSTADRGYRTAVIISVTVSPTTTDYGIMPVSQVKKAGTANANNEFIVTNAGNVAEDFDITSSNATGGTGWTLSTTAVGSSIFMHAYSALKTLAASLTLGSVGEQATKWVAMDVSPNYRPLASNVASSGTVNLILELLSPSSIGGGDYGVTKNITVTVRATAH